VPTLLVFIFFPVLRCGLLLFFLASYWEQTTLSTDPSPVILFSCSGCPAFPFNSREVFLFGCFKCEKFLCLSVRPLCLQIHLAFCPFFSSVACHYLLVFVFLTSVLHPQRARLVVFLGGAVRSHPTLFVRVG